VAPRQRKRAGTQNI